MSWVTAEDVTDVYPNVTVTEAFIAHTQSLAESCVGEQEEPVSSRLAAAFVEVVHRRHLAAQNNPEGVGQTQLGPFMQSTPAAPGLGLSDRDCKMLKKAVGMSGLWIQPTTRGPVETPSGSPHAQEWDDPLMGAF